MLVSQSRREFLDPCFLARVGRDFLDLCLLARGGREFLNFCLLARVGREFLDLCDKSLVVFAGRDLVLAHGRLLVECAHEEAEEKGRSSVGICTAPHSIVARTQLGRMSVRGGGCRDALPVTLRVSSWTWSLSPQQLPCQQSTETMKRTTLGGGGGLSLHHLWSGWMEHKAHKLT